MHDFQIQSHNGTYDVCFDDALLDKNTLISLGTHFVVDKNVFPHLGETFCNQVQSKKIILIDANEETKSFRGVEPIIDFMIENNLKRDSKLVAIGGGITQDIVCFIATTYMRGIPWTFIPTTLLAQADSCIGSKSSINFKSIKNLLGSFNPPNRVIISNQFLKTLDTKDIKSGIGEIIKLFLIDGRNIDINQITLDNLSYYVFEALQIKKNFIEVDEFDKGIRNILNYGHCFGHAIESATHYAIPHGIAISIGMDAANKFALMNNLIDTNYYYEMQKSIQSNYQDYLNVPIELNQVFNALTKDKKNTGNKINLILPVGDKMEKRGFETSNDFWNMAKQSLESLPITVR